jgi:hypothetical protein
MSFATTHTATLLKYGGISFIAGAVNHGMFSESRFFGLGGIEAVGVNGLTQDIA